MNILIVGGGGREHALAWKLRQSGKVENLFVAPGNAGTAQVATNVPLSDAEGILSWLKENCMDLVIVGPDEYLAGGMIDRLQGLGIPAFGPTQAAAEVEWSKAFAKDFMMKAGIPTAKYKAFKDAEEAKVHVSLGSFPVVIKASGLAFGKGVVIAASLAEAETALDEMMGDRIFGEAGAEVVIEEFLRGTEISVHAFCDGEHAVLFPPAQDHKRIFEGDKGPNTGGMGTIAPVPNITGEQMRDIQEQVVLPTLSALKEMGRPFKGILFPGIMLTEDGPKVIEFNARFGDPETQSYMRILESNLEDILMACIDGTLESAEIQWSDKTACCIVLASGGYPGPCKKGMRIEGLDEAGQSSSIEIFHAGTSASEEGGAVTDGGRVLGLTAVGDSLAESLAVAYEAAGKISFEGMQYRRDIGSKSL